MSIDGSIIYCDDLRIENNGKLFLIGVYNHDMVIDGQFPAYIGRLQLFMRFKYSLEYCDKQILLNIYYPTDTDTPSFVKKSKLAKAPTAEERSKIHLAWSDGPLYGHISMPITLEDLEVTTLSFVRVELVVDGKSHRFNSLRILASDQSDL